MILRHYTPTSTPQLPYHLEIPLIREDFTPDEARHLARLIPHTPVVKIHRTPTRHILTAQFAQRHQRTAAIEWFRTEIHTPFHPWDN